MKLNENIQKHIYKKCIITIYYNPVKASICSEIIGMTLVECIVRLAGTISPMRALIAGQLGKVIWNGRQAACPTGGMFPPPEGVWLSRPGPVNQGSRAGD